MKVFVRHLSVLLFVTISCFGHLLAQEYEPFIKSDAVWTAARFGGWPDYSAMFNYKKYSFVGDTLINGETYQRLYRTTSMLTFDIDSAEYVAAMRENSRQVFIVPQNESSEALYLDYSLDVGDITTVYTPTDFITTVPSLEVEVVEKDSVLLENGEYRNRIRVQYDCNSFNYSEYWIEGVGSTAGIFRSLEECYIADIGFNSMICYEDKGSLIYKINGALSCTQLAPIEVYEYQSIDDTICLGQTATILYEVYGGTYPFDVDISPEEGVIDAGLYGFQVEPDTTTTYTLTITDLSGETVELSYEIIVEEEAIAPVDIDIINPSGECFPNSLILSANNTYDFYEWRDIQNNIIGTEQSVTVYSSGNYYLTVSNAAGCSETDYAVFYQTLNVNPTPNVENNIEGYVCLGDTLKYWTEEPYASYSWSTGETTDTISFVADETGVFSISLDVVDFNGCAGPNINISYGYWVQELPSIPSITQNGSVLTSSEASTYQWYLDGTPIEGATEQTYTATMSGAYTVEVTEGDAPCISISAALIVEASQLARQVAIKVYLEGAYDASLGEMDNKLLDLDLLPPNQPYNMMPWNYGGTESVMSSADFPSNTVDWVLVEARTGTPNQSGSMGTTVVETKAGLLLSDGSIVDAQSLNPLSFWLLEDGTAYYFIVRHRNHLDVISANSVVGATMMEYDFTTAVNQAFGIEQMKMMDTGEAALLAGDYNQSGDIQNTDYDDWKVSPAVNQEYLFIDGNMDGISQVSDYDTWYFNRAKLGVIEIRY